MIPVKRTAGSTGGVIATGTTMIAFQIIAAAAIMVALCLMTISGARRPG